jgi:hypothetical protein
LITLIDEALVLISPNSLEQGQGFAKTAGKNKVYVKFS